MSAHAMAQAEPAPVAEPDTQDTPTSIALVISGGVSLGAYQAGATYALVRYLRANESRYRLEVATGASAGNINAFLAALTWCAKEDPSVFHNNFYDTWSDVGWDQLSPSVPTNKTYVDGADEPAPRDGLLARNAFEDAEANLKRQLKTGSFRAACTVQIGVTVNRVKPEPVKGGGWVADAQRYVVPMTFQARESGSGVGIVNRPLGADEHREMGLELRLESDELGALTPDTVLDVVKASSAFPGAFGAVDLSYCPSSGNIDDKACLPPPQGKAQQSAFSDGGLFDNIPLSLARSLWAEQPAAPSGKSTPIYAYVDSDLRRGAPQMPPTRVRAEGTAAALDLAGRLVGEGRHYELLSGTMDGVKPSSRFHPLMGDVFASFGAFFHRAFREYDYRVGLYDGIYTLAQFSGKGPAPEPETFQRIRDQVLAIPKGCAGSDKPPPAECARLRVLQSFLDRLFDREQVERQRGTLSASRKVKRQAAEPSFAASMGDVSGLIKPTEPGDGRWVEQARWAWTVDEVLRDLDRQRRRRHQIGERVDRRDAEAQMSDIVTIMDRLEQAVPGILGDEANWPGRTSSAAVGDGRVWQHRMLDRLLRRAIMVQEHDLEQCVEGCEDGIDHSRPALELARLGLALTAERPRGWDLELAGIDERLAGDMPRSRLPTLISALVPSTVMLGTVDGQPTQLELGYAVNDILRSHKAGGLGAGLRLETIYAVPGLERDAAEDDGGRWALRVALGLQMRFERARLTLEGTARPGALIPEPADPAWGVGLALDLGTAIPLRLRAGVEWERDGDRLVSFAAGFSDVGVVMAEGFDRPGWGPLHSPPASLWWVPYTVAWEPGLSGIRVGQGVRLRHDAFVMPLDVTYAYRALRGENEQHNLRGELGVGFDPAGWLIDDIALRGQWTLNQRTVDDHSDGWGVELSVVALRLISLGVGIDRLGAAPTRQASGEVQPGWTPVLSVGLVNLDSLVAWAARSGWGFDEVRP